MYPANIVLISVCIINFFERVKSAPSDGSSALLYLSHYGYLEANGKDIFNSSKLMDGSTLTGAIADFQKFAGLKVTGELDSQTLTTMSMPRCGVKDKVGSLNNGRSKRYALQGSRWRTKNLKYGIRNYPKAMSKRDVDKEIARAFNVWAKYTDLSFRKSNGDVQIEIKFVVGEHGDEDEFDGPQGTLAHAFFPIFGGDAHFDDSEKWSINTYEGINLFQVAVHEFGHALGLSHSSVESALMAPFYRGFQPRFKLNIDDIKAIQAVYGRKTRRYGLNLLDDDNGIENGSNEESDGDESDDNKESKSDETDEALQDKSEELGEAGVSEESEESPVIPSTNSNLCANTKIDTIFNTPEGNTYVFKGNNYWKLTEGNVAIGYPKVISEGWPGLPGDIDAAFMYKNGKNYFFKGEQYWRYQGRKVQDRYPRQISKGFPGIPNDLEAATVWNINEKIYFFKGTKYWKYDHSQMPHVKSMYPRPISDWKGIPDNLDAVLQYTNGSTYFFKNDGYFRFNNEQFSVDPEFPRSTGKWWLGCTSISNTPIDRRTNWRRLLNGESNNYEARNSIDSVIRRY